MYRRVALLSDDLEFHYRILAICAGWRTLARVPGCRAASRFDTPLGIRAADTPCFPCLRRPNGFLIREHRVPPIRQAPCPDSNLSKYPGNFPVVHLSSILRECRRYSLPLIFR